jgi:hypothetical protein
MRPPGGRRWPIPQGRNVQVAPNPFAVALTAAMRWTSSNEQPDPIGATRSARVQHARDAVHASEPMSGPARATPREPPTRATQPPRGDAVAATHRGPHSAATPEVPARPAQRETPEPADQRFTGIHIGSLEVQILPPPEAVIQPVHGRSVASNAAPAAPLARGFTSAIGLRQS